jgi:hypothetical protein
MTTKTSSKALDPSEYVAQHQQHFAESLQSGIENEQHIGLFWWNVDALLLSGILFVVLIGIVAVRERGAVFRIERSMSFGKRLRIWWSCAWRQWLASALLAVMGVFAFYLVDAMFALQITHWAVALGKPPSPATEFAWPLALKVMLGVLANFFPVVVGILVYTLLSLPLAGYMVRSGLVAHTMPAPARFGLWRATLLGWTTYVWSVPGGLAIAGVAAPLPHQVAVVLRCVLCVAWGMYIVLPRQVRRVAGFAATSIHG